MADTKLPIKDKDTGTSPDIIPLDTSAARLPLVTTDGAALPIPSGVLGIIENSAKLGLEKYANTAAAIGKQFSDSVVLTDIQRTARALTEIATSPSILQATQVLHSTKALSDALATLTEPAIRISEATKAIAEPLDRLRSSVVSLNKKYDFDLSIEAIDLYPSVSPSPSYSPSPSPSPSPAFEVKAAVMALVERLDNLGDEITHKVEKKFQEQFDNFQKKSIIGSEAQEKLLYCKYCNTQLFKIRDFPAFILGIRTHKCTNKDCGRALQIPADLKIKDL